jgi:hypothetical protein
MDEHVLNFEDVYREEQPVASFDRGIIDVELAHIVGTVGRYRDFDEGFNAFSRDSRRRLARIREALLKKEPLPPLELYKIKDSFFIIDGHHRVMIARQLGVSTLKAHVVEHLPPRNSADNILSREKSEFELVTGLMGISLTELSQYQKLLNQIREHKYYLGEKKEREVTFKDASADWSAAIYVPLINRIEEEHILNDYPGRTTADLYVYISDHKWMESQRKGYDIGFSSALEAFHKTNSPHSLKEVIKDFFSSFSPITPRRRAFEEKTGLRRITISDERAYTKLMKQIKEHKYYLSQEAGTEITLKEAASHWYSEIFEPFIRIIEEERYASGFPRKTSADLYLSISELKWLESEKRGYDIGFAEAYKEFKKQKKDHHSLRSDIKNLLGALKGRFLEGPQGSA